MFYLISAGLLLIALICACTKIMTGLGIGFSLGDAERGGAVAFTVIFALVALAACAMLALFNMPENISKICKIAAPSGAAIALLVFIIGYFGAKGEAYGLVSLSFSGWITILFFLGAIGLTAYLLYTDLKKKPAAPTYTPPYNPYG